MLEWSIYFKQDFFLSNFTKIKTIIKPLLDIFDVRSKRNLFSTFTLHVYITDILAEQCQVLQKIVI